MEDVTTLLEAIRDELREMRTLFSERNKKWLTTREAAEYTGYKEKYIYNLIMKKRIPVHRNGGKNLFLRDELDKWLIDDKKDQDI